MPNDVEIINPIPQILQIGECSIFPESVKISGNSSVSEKATVSGGTAVTNRGIKSSLISFSGKLVENTEYITFILNVENMLKNKTANDISYGGFLFKSCVLKTYSAETVENIVEIKLIFTTSEVLASGG